MELGRIGVIIFARTDSSRLPGKALLPLAGSPMVSFLLNRLAGFAAEGGLMLATTDRPVDDALAAVIAEAGVPVHRGSAADLIERTLGAARCGGFDTIVRVTGDCPFVDEESLRHCLDLCAAAPAFDIASTKGRFPVGLDFEIVPVERLARIAGRADLDESHREHLTLYLYHHPEEFTVLPLDPRPEWRSDQVWTVDVPEDYDKARRVAESPGGATISLEALAGWGNPSRRGAAGE